MKTKAYLPGDFTTSSSGCCTESANKLLCIPPDALIFVNEGSGIGVADLGALKYQSESLLLNTHLMTKIL